MYCACKFAHLKDSSRSRICARNDTANGADRFGEDHNAHLIVDLENATGLIVFVLVVDVLGAEVVLDHLVFDDPHAGFFSRHFRQRNASIGCCQSCCSKDPIDLLLRVSGKDLLSCLDSFYQLIELLKVRHDLLGCSSVCVVCMYLFNIMRKMLQSLVTQFLLVRIRTSYILFLFRCEPQQ